MKSQVALMMPAGNASTKQHYWRLLVTATCADGARCQREDRARPNGSVQVKQHWRHPTVTKQQQGQVAWLAESRGLPSNPVWICWESQQSRSQKTSRDWRPVKVDKRPCNAKGLVLDGTKGKTLCRPLRLPHQKTWRLTLQTDKQTRIQVVLEPYRRQPLTRRRGKGYCKSNHSDGKASSIAPTEAKTTIMESVMSTIAKGIVITICTTALGEGKKGSQSMLKACRRQIEPEHWCRAEGGHICYERQRRPSSVIRSQCVRITKIATPMGTATTEMGTVDETGMTILQWQLEWHSSRTENTGGNGSAGKDWQLTNSKIVARQSQNGSLRPTHSHSHQGCLPVAMKLHCNTRGL